MPYFTADEKTISYLEDLSYLTLSDDEKIKLTEDLGKILGNMAKLSELTTDNTGERSHIFDNVNAFRDDILQPSFERELILQNAPRRSGEAFIAPKTVE